MSERLYYTDAYLTRFDAHIIGRTEHEGRPALLLDRTAFYPASGGQPADRGTIRATPVVDVVEREDGRILHVVEHIIEGDGPVVCEIEWERRRDHMQQHTGQHLLSAVLERLRGARTESFHLGVQTSTIDIAATLTIEQLAPVEVEANRIVWENRRVQVRFADEAEAATLPLRKPPARGGTLRVIEIEDYDCSACGGTHVARTGELGLVALTGAERYKGGTRVEFVCGGRALLRFQAVRASLTAAARLLSSGAAEVPAAVQRLDAELRDQRHLVKRWQERAIAADAERLIAGGSGARLVIARHLPDWDRQALKGLAAALCAHPGAVVVLVGSEPPAVIVAGGPESGVDAAAIVRELTSRFGGRGGGRREMAEAGGLGAAPAELLEAAVRMT